ncbi:cupin domain-containing protein [Alteromonas sp. a30]|uniref:cupin domain-containing protein n=1 Tax=Alteromonas sp. a30 TaxID=2730917 RepID=UPI002282A511|nr:cupin domain-containing protein [Alteromonas sp. a30]MCY7293984.1 cupin domain-containing protein [Alteromonas sp. a30]
MLNFDIQHFLTHYWQKQPLVIKAGVPDFHDPLDEHDLAGLAQLDEVDSRIIRLEQSTSIQKQWYVEQGPFESFDEICKGKWTLLAQGVNHYIEDACDLLDAFNFIPHWRIDDLMVSYSVAGAGVGPHIDQYDVFIIQGKGSRRWQVGAKDEHNEYLPHPLLKQIEMFEPIIDEVLESGDIIYIPPGFPHNGIALTECLNYSVGFRAPSQVQLLDNFTNYCLEHQLAEQRYQDPDLALREHSAEMTMLELTKLRALLKNAIDSPSFESWFLSFNSSLALNCDDENSEDEANENTPESLPHDMLLQAPYPTLLRNLDTHTVCIAHDAQSLHFGINGITQHISASEEEIIHFKSVLSARIVSSEDIASFAHHKQLIRYLSFWVMQGYWEVVDESDDEKWIDEVSNLENDDG